MKTRYFWLFGVLLAVLGVFSMSINAFAQLNSIKSDTLTLTPSRDSLGFEIQDFGSDKTPIQSGTKVCHTIYFRNSSNKMLIVQFITVDGPLIANPIPTFPLIMLPNEIVSSANLCFTPQNPTSSEVEGRFRIISKIGSDYVDIGGSTRCFQIIDTLVSKPFITTTLGEDIFGPVIMDGDVSHTATLTSNRRESILVRMDTAIYGDGIYFHVTGITFPYSMGALEVKNFTITYSPRSNVPVVNYRSVGMLSLQASHNNEIAFPKFTLAGVAIPPTADSTSTALAAGSTDILAMISDNSVTTQTFHFKNTGTTNLKITAVDLKNKKSFAITDIQPSNTLPFTLTPGQSMSVTVAMTTVTNGVYYDEVIITAENAIISMDFPLQGLRKNGLAGVNNTSTASQSILLYPNPSQGTITVSIPGIHNAKIQVLDLLGRVITSAVASQRWTWNSTEPAGTYILHLAGSDDTGKTFQSYDRFIIAK